MLIDVLEFEAFRFSDDAGGHQRLPVELPIESITFDPIYQPRERLDAKHIGALRSAIESLPPVLVWQRDGRFLLLDGFHRIAALRSAGKATVNAYVADLIPNSDVAREWATFLNATHGKPLTNREKAASARWFLTHSEYRNLPNTEIARRVGCSHEAVRRYRLELVTDSVSRTVEAKIRRTFHIDKSILQQAVSILERSPGVHDPEAARLLDCLRGILLHG